VVVEKSFATEVAPTRIGGACIFSIAASDRNANVNAVQRPAGDGFFWCGIYKRGDALDVYARIRSSSLRHDVAELEHQQMNQRWFNRWFMAFREAPASVLQRLSQEQWLRELPWIEQHATQSSGIRYLLELFSEPSDSAATPEVMIKAASAAAFPFPLS
jgi:hypothetical protein